MRISFSSQPSRSIVPSITIGSSSERVSLLSPMISRAFSRVFSRKLSVSSNLQPMNWYFHVVLEIWRSILSSVVLRIIGPVERVMRPEFPLRCVNGYEKNVVIKEKIRSKVVDISIYLSYTYCYHRFHTWGASSRMLVASSGVTWCRWFHHAVRE